MYVVMIRGRGLVLVEPLPNETQAEAVEKSLGLKGGYSAGLVQIDMPEGVGEAWIALVAGEGPTGATYYDYRAFSPTLTEEQVHEQLTAAGEEAVKLNRSHIFGAGDRNAAPESDDPPVIWKG